MTKEQPQGEESPSKNDRKSDEPKPVEVLGDIEEKPTSDFNSEEDGEDADHFPYECGVEDSEGMSRYSTNQLPPTSRRTGWRNRDQSSVAQILRGLGGDNQDLHPALERRIRDFRFAQQKRREKYGTERPWGILGLYDYLASIRIDIEWAEDAAWRRQHNEPYLSWTDFEEARAKGFNRPFFTYFVLLVCTVMLIVSIGVNGWRVEPLKINPMIGPSAETLLDLGAKQSSLIVNDGEWYRLFTPMVLHAGLIHYFVNMLALWFVGSAVEQSHGFVNSAIAFVIAGVGGTVLSAIFLPQYVSVGASGGIFGFIGLCFSDIVVNWSLLFTKLDEGQGNRLRHAMVVVWLIVDMILNGLIGLTPYVDNFTHLGGFLYGFLCGLSTIERLDDEFFGLSKGPCGKFRDSLIRFAGLILSVILIMVSTAVLVDSDGTRSPCHNCRYVSCVPFPPWQENKWWYCDDCNQVEADAHKVDSTSPIYDSLTLTCPDGTMEMIDISAEQLTNTNQIIPRLQGYCRTNCDSVFNAAGG